ncbi:ATP-binding protein [Actinomadura decatromicini]|uniref:ATP-binding protein n=1 Tax=Actinomadura decatromicini TaxID=2604572 RepID=UPI001FEB437A|nr:ATP-binding protein [Actinomadura decatromicini]
MNSTSAQPTAAEPTAETMSDAMTADAITADAATAAAGRSARVGARPGWVWALPGGPGCAGHARRVLRDALATLGVPPGAICDAQLMVSELATNAHQHAGDHGPHELWLYLGGAEPPEPPEPPDAGAAGEVRCAIFDAFAEAALPGYSWTSGDCGRGLSIVRELSGGRWGTRRARSRLGPSVRGKAVWFAVPGATAAAALR